MHLRVVRPFLRQQFLYRLQDPEPNGFSPHVTGSKAPLIDFCTFTLTHDDIEVIVFGKRRKTPDVPGVQEFGYRSL